MSEDIKKLAARVRKHVEHIYMRAQGIPLCDWSPMSADIVSAADALEALAGEVTEALPWKLFYKDGLDLEQIGERLGKSPYDLSPWLYAPLISQLKDREKTALADLAAERDRLKAAGFKILAKLDHPTASVTQWDADELRAALGDAS